MIQTPALFKKVWFSWSSLCPECYLWHFQPDSCHDPKCSLTSLKEAVLVTLFCFIVMAFAIKLLYPQTYFPVTEHVFWIYCVKRGWDLIRVVLPLDALISKRQDTLNHKWLWHWTSISHQSPDADLCPIWTLCVNMLIKAA